VGGYYIASNDSLEVRDYFDNGRWTIVFVKVGGEGTARYTSKGEKLRELDLDYPEGRSIKIKACTSASPNAVCSAWSPAGTT
jgi:hypothetical protein